jgi:hypothetical protein
LDHRCQPELETAARVRFASAEDRRSDCQTSGFDQDLKKNEIFINEQAKADEIVAEASNSRSSSTT